MRAGDRVIAVDNLSSGFFTSVPKGTLGTITGVSGFFSTTYSVTFDNGQRMQLDGRWIRLA